MNMALNWKDYFPKVDILIENLIYNLNKEADRVQIFDDYAKLNLKLKKKFYVSPRGLLRSFKIDGKPVGNVNNAAFTLTYGKYETININADIDNHPELYSFIPITKGDDLRYTVSKYSPFFEKYFDPNAKDIEVFYTFSSMFVRVEEKKKIKAYLFDLGTNGLSMHTILKAFCRKLDMGYDPYRALYIGTLQKPEFVIAAGYNKKGFVAVKSIIDQMRFFKTNFMKYCLYYDYDIRKKTVDTIKSYVVNICLNYMGYSLDDLITALGITFDEFDSLVNLKTKELITSNGNKITLDTIIDYLGVEEDITSQYREKVNLLTEVAFKEIPTV